MDHSQEESKYYRVENWCREQISNGSEFLFEPVLFEGAMKAASESFDFPLASLTSLFRNIYDKHIKSTSHQVQALLQTKLVQEYLAGKSIKDIAKEINFSPAMLARRVVEEMTELAGKKKLSTAMKNPLEELGTIAVIKQKYQISETDLQEEWRSKLPAQSRKMTRLALEVKEAIDSDSLCGPTSDRAKHFIGIEYEIVLERGLKNLGIPFESEAQLREKGSSRTPDVVLSCPISVQVNSEWHIVCWIDSKALYGDIVTHRKVHSQAKAYVHRFGPGMILYWFGHAPLSKLENAEGDLVIVGWKLPETILWPTGEVQHGPSRNEENIDSEPAHKDVAAKLSHSTE